MIRFVGTDPIDAAQFMSGVGDQWMDTSTMPPTLKVCTQMTPVAFRPLATQASLKLPIPVASFNILQALPPLPTAPTSLAQLPAWLNNVAIPYVNSIVLPALQQYVMAQAANDLVAVTKALIDICKDSGVAVS